MDYATLKVIWWLLLGVLFIGFAVMDGADMGVGSLLPFVGKNDEERRVVINTVAPHWDGNQVWLICAGGVLFAAWPMVYATAFSGFYWAMLAALWPLFFRPVGFDYRSKLRHPRWRKTWDGGLFIGSFVPPVIFGVAFGNLLQGVPFHLDDLLRSYYTGSFWALLNPFALLCGVVSSSMLIAHGAVYLAHRTEGEIRRRAQKAGGMALAVFLTTFTLAGVWVAAGIDGYALVSGSYEPSGVANPLYKEAVRQSGAWLNNYSRYPLTILVPAAAYVGLIAAWLLARAGKTFAAFWASAVGLLGVIGTAGVSMFPFLLPSSSDPASSLTVWDGTSSRLTLIVMLVVTGTFVPLIIVYTTWCFRIMRGTVTTRYIRQNDHHLY